MKISSKFCQYISKCAIDAVLFEVSTSPKPGLVDRYNAGAHHDMNFFTFISSSSAISYYYYLFTEKGIEHSNKHPQELFQLIRMLGVEAERDMYFATKGVNTHKGMIFSLGIICAAAGYIFSKSGKRRFSVEQICKMVSIMTDGICKRELEIKRGNVQHTNGEKIYIKYGITGVRGEVENGFETVRKVSLPVFKSLLNKSCISINDILIQVLLHLMANTQDTNVIARHDLKVAEYVKDTARSVLEKGGVFSKKGADLIKEVDEDFIEKSISPGGTADLLAVTMMLFFLEEPDYINHIKW